MTGGIFRVDAVDRAGGVGEEVTIRASRCNTYAEPDGTIKGGNIECEGCNE